MCLHSLCWVFLRESFEELHPRESPKKMHLFLLALPTPSRAWGRGDQG